MHGGDTVASIFACCIFRVTSSSSWDILNEAIQIGTTSTVPSVKYCVELSQYQTVTVISLWRHVLIISTSLFSAFPEARERVQTLENQRCATSRELRCRAREEERPSSRHGHGHQVVQCVRGQRSGCPEGLHRKGSLLACRGTTFRVRSVPQHTVFLTVIGAN